MSLLEIEDLHVEAGGRKILKGVSLTVEEGETCVLFGPNGSGKSTLLSAIMGFSSAKVTQGRIIFKGRDITGLPVDARARLGIGMMMQRPPNVIGVRLGDLIEVAARNGHGSTGHEGEFRMDSMMDRDVNVGFSGGEIKRSEMLQLTAQAPDLVMLDEPESGVDLESINMIGSKVRDLIENNGRRTSAFVITHTGQIMDFIDVNKGYIMIDGRIRSEGDPREVLDSIKAHGYGVDDE